ncbi:MAG: methyltransferase domain-containing protein [Armatimonadetes bacterium]|nr:methyltransferase domain-containing protein [Anaerolineae bacterium]
MNGDAKALSQQRFSQYAERYVQSTTHAVGADLQRLVELAQPQPTDLALDIATGGGHTALVFAPLVASVVAGDISAEMLVASRRNHIAKGALNLTYANTDAEKLAFADNSFDLVTCRIAPHHFPDVYRFVVECARVLKPGGRLVIMDQTVPEDDAAARYIDAFERLRDPSHHRIYSESEWRGTYLDAGLTIISSELTHKVANLLEWAVIQDCPPDLIERLHVMMAQAPDAVREWVHPRYINTPEADFWHVYVLIVGVKPV